MALPPPRPLDPSEHKYWVAAQLGPAAQLVVAHGSGALDMAALRASALAAQRRHPHLQARFDGAGFAFGDAPPLEVRERAGPVAQAWGEAATEALLEPFPERGPLVRVDALREPDRWALMLGFHHAAADGRAMFRLTRELLAGMAGQALPPHVPAAPPLADLLPPAARDPALRRRAILRALGRLGLLFARAPDLAEAHPPFAARRTRTAHRALGTEATAALAARCRERGVTVQAALAAALLLAVRDEDGLRRATPMACGHAVDMRPWLAPPPGEAMGNYSLEVLTLHRVRPDTAAWALAAEAKQELAASLDRGEHFLAAQRGKADPAKARRFQRPRRAPIPCVAVTNFGRLEAAPRYGGAALEGFAGIPGMELAYVLAFVDAATVAGNLEVNLVHADPVVSPARGERLLRAMLGHLGVESQAL